MQSLSWCNHPFLEHNASRYLSCVVIFYYAYGRVQAAPGVYLPTALCQPVVAWSGRVRYQSVIPCLLQARNGLAQLVDALHEHTRCCRKGANDWRTFCGRIANWMHLRCHTYDAGHLLLAQACIGFLEQLDSAADCWGGFWLQELHDRFGVDRGATEKAIFRDHVARCGAEATFPVAKSDGDFVPGRRSRREQRAPGFLDVF